MIDKKEFERAKNIILDIRKKAMTINELDYAIELINKLKEKVAAVQSGKYYDLPLTDEQKLNIIEEIKSIKAELQTKAADMDINIGG